MPKTLHENDLLIRNKYKIANIFDNFFVNVVQFIHLQ